MAPEQTGRIEPLGRLPQRLYALGVTFYEMLTVKPPFAAADPMEWIDCHIARQPVPPDTSGAGSRKTRRDHVLKLLAKTAEDRYQTAPASPSDLQRCLAEWEATGGIEAIPAGAAGCVGSNADPREALRREGEIGHLLAGLPPVLVTKGTHRARCSSPAIPASASPPS